MPGLRHGGRWAAFPSPTPTSTGSREPWGPYGIRPRWWRRRTGPPELYVESQGELRSVLRSHGVTPGTPSAGRVAVCPSRYGWSVPAQLPDHDFPVANHVVVALDLAQDRGRGREILEGWNPEGHVRVW